MTVLLQVSDPHFGTERPRVVAALERFSQALRPDLLLLSGDITQRARPAQFAAARAFVDRLDVPAWLAIPGNHDIPLYNLGARLLRPYGHFNDAFGPALEGEYESDSLLLLALNTTRWWRHMHGEVSAAQVERVAQRLARARPGQCRVVAVHQPVAVTRPQDQVNLLRGHEHAVRRWAEAGLDVVMGGHIHLPFIVPLRERWPELPRPMWAVQAGTALSTRVRAGMENSVNVLRLGAAAGEGAHPGDPDRPRCVAERWDHDPRRGEFVLAGSAALDTLSPGR